MLVHVSSAGEGELEERGALSKPFDFGNIAGCAAAR
jgi:hypothetical protein